MFFMHCDDHKSNFRMIDFELKYMLYFEYEK